VIVLTTSTPQFYAKVFGIISKAYTIPLKGNYYNPSILFEIFSNYPDTSISIAPPPETNLGFTNIFLVTARQSYKFLSISFKTSLELPLNKIEQANGSLHSVKNV